MNFTIEMDSNYKGKRKDILKLKFSSFLWTIVLGVFAFFTGVYISFINYNRVINDIVFAIGIIVMIIGVLFLVCSPFVLLFKGLNRKLKGKITFAFTKGEDQKWAYTLTATKNDKLFQESGFITMVMKKKCFFDLFNNKGNEYYIPMKVLSEEQLGNLNSLASDFIAKKENNPEGTDSVIATMEVTTRNFVYEDIRKLIPILLGVWDYDNLSSLENREKATELFLLFCLANSDYRRVLIVDGSVSGIICSRTKPGYTDEKLLSQFENLSKEYRKDKELNEICHYNDVIFEAERVLIGKDKEKLHEIVLLINDNKIRGKGLGKRLIDEFYQSEEKHTPIILCSDKDCNYHFYEHLGFKIIDNCDLPYSLFDDKKVLHSFLFIKE